MNVHATARSLRPFLQQDCTRWPLGRKLVIKANARQNLGNKSPAVAFRCPKLPSCKKLTPRGHPQGMRFQSSIGATGDDTPENVEVEDAAPASGSLKLAGTLIGVGLAAGYVAQLPLAKVATLLQNLDYFGTAVFSSSTTLLAGKQNMDVFGCMVMGTIAAIGGAGEGCSVRPRQPAKAAPSAPDSRRGLLRPSQTAGEGCSIRPRQPARAAPSAPDSRRGLLRPPQTAGEGCSVRPRQPARAAPSAPDSRRTPCHLEPSSLPLHPGGDGGRLPAWWMTQTEYVWIALIASATTFALARFAKFSSETASELQTWADAVSLAAFATIGAQLATARGYRAQLATARGYSALIAVLCGIFSGTFGGLIRDVCCRLPPMILTRELYAVAAAAGAAAYVALFPISSPQVAIAGGFFSAG
ncbi:hypothetical protein CYMTET_33015 [Cymbomonas tetramitiformis]|uniref:Glycine transporter domain-containing protein n=1 Tax=Cymbomonas tetramitiformis TaxID=36881 RepID=A0AAE0KRM7_9CHLO|nr:hypothetical protein CYMTET_33015 [Cymbomonas tetramitiformis]